MKVTQKVIDIARKGIPSRPSLEGEGAVTSRVYPSMVGMSDTHETAVDIVFEAGYGDGGRPCWICITPMEPNIGRGLKTEAVISTERCFSEFKPTLNVADLKLTVKDSGAHVIERLEQALAMAKEGYVSNVAVLIVQENGDVMDCWANGSSPFTMVGGLESLKFEFMNACIEGR